MISKELLKLIPENYKMQILPSFFNYTDSERIRTVISDQAKDFILVISILTNKYFFRKHLRKLCSHLELRFILSIIK